MSLRIVMWTCPRNISTAMMRAWGNRADTYVCDEPLYAYYLNSTGKIHPATAEIMVSQPTDWREVVKWLMGPIPEGKSIFFQKHMSHHLLPEVDRGWLAEVRNCFLIRHPLEVIASYMAKQGLPALDDLGFVEQAEIFDYLRATSGTIPPVLDAKDVQQDPRGQLMQLCATLNVRFDEAMLSWPAGPRPTDGVWSKHWYSEVERSTGFLAYERRYIEIPSSLGAIYGRCMDCYEKLYEHRLR